MSGLEIVRPKPDVPAGLTADRRLCLTADRNTVVEDGDIRSAYLLAGPGAVIPAAEAARLGLTMEDGTIVLPAGNTPEKGGGQEPGPSPTVGEPDQSTALTKGDPELDEATGGGPPAKE